MQSITSQAPSLRIPATYMRGGTSKGVFFNVADLPTEAQQAGTIRDKVLMRVIGSPDPYGKQIDGMGGATSSTSKTVLVAKSSHQDHDVDYWFGQVGIETAFVDWSGNCGNLSAAVGPFAIHAGLIDEERLVHDGWVAIKIWQANIQKTIVAYVPIKNGQVVEHGDFELDGVTNPAAEIKVEFHHPSDDATSMFPTGNVVDKLDVPGVGQFKTTMISAGIPTIFMDAEALGFLGTETQSDINGDTSALNKFETIRAYGALAMGLIDDLQEAEHRQHTPKIAFVGTPKDYLASSGKRVKANDIDVLVRALSMGKLHHAMMGTAAVAIASAASVPGTIVNRAAGGEVRESVTFGHPSGTLTVGAKSEVKEAHWIVEKAVMSRSARILMEGWVRVPAYIVDANE
ncbi:putative methylaconitate Delta-isomerase PrpF [Vibrio sp. 10N.286.49.C2]|uniref:2-methylaconitate cis-trans isomerase PrpF n=1 Tax=unclassified Vibrio TaxID=2614977 RepID=UPI000C84B490|nr:MULTISPECIES: 2-methylaconitate cis-trans isomerase PrpF [unclassified Vibrio]PMH37272.1 putative methylaconitate Delta-isomerase PrpF [Vibrio sp. 10N.286.49.C2]PMH57417.1 putative methylaconitate Delta-isomerase PrpF [Vibrio sp. 10N.286.49.B1]